MAKKAGVWVQSQKCLVCNKTGKVPNEKDPSKQDKCTFCSGTGYIRSKGTISS